MQIRVRRSRNFTNTSIRGSLLFEPSDTFTALVKAEYISNDDLPQVRRGEQCTAPWLNCGNGFYTDDPAGYTDSCEEWTALQDNSRKWHLDRDMLFLTADLTWEFGNDIALTVDHRLSGRRARYGHGRIRNAVCTARPARQ